MGRVMMRAGGGLTQADRAKLVPGNIRQGVVLFEGTSRQVDGILASKDGYYALYDLGTMMFGTTISATAVPGYKNLSESNFVLEFANYSGSTGGSSGSWSWSPTKTYNKNTGVLSVTRGTAAGSKFDVTLRVLCLVVQ